MQAFDHTTADSTTQALTILQADASGASKLIAGGTDLLTLMKGDLLAPARLIDIKPIRSLRYIRFADDDGLTIGAGTTLAEIGRDATLAERFPILPQSVRDAATPQLRVMATVGGNLLQRPRCWYFRGPYTCWLKGGEECFAREGENKYQGIFEQSLCAAVHPSDLAPALIALNASVEIEGPNGARTLPVSDLLQPPTADRRTESTLADDELITAIHIPAQPANAHGVYLKAMDRRAWAFALVSAAAHLATDDNSVMTHVRLVLGGVANVPYRATDAEALLIGKPLTPELAAQAAEAAMAGATPLTHNGYKVPLARELVQRALLAAAKR